MTKFLGPYFIKPVLKEEVYPDFSMFVELERLFSKIVPGSIVRGALYMWNKDAGLNKSKYREKWKEEPGNPLFVTDQFLLKSRDCDSQLILDNYSSEYHKKTLKHLMVSLGEKNIFIDPRQGENDPEYRRKLFESGERAKFGYMHDKFFLISELEGIGKYVIIQLTANINVTQCHQFNNMLVVYDDKDLFDKYLMHWDNLKNNIEMRNRGETILNLNMFSEIPAEIDKESRAAVFFCPRKTCPIEFELRKILNYAPSSRVKIDVAMAYLTRSNFADVLSKLKRNGCRVRILLSEEVQNENAREFLRKYKLKYRILKNHMYNYETYTDENGKKRIQDNWKARMHHKFVLIENDRRYIVWTGSYNLTFPGLKLNDESVLRVCDKSVFRRYRKMFNLLWHPYCKFKKLMI